MRSTKIILSFIIDKITAKEVKFQEHVETYVTRDSAISYKWDSSMRTGNRVNYVLIFTSVSLLIRNLLGIYLYTSIYV